MPQTDAVEDLFTTQVVAAEENPSDAAAHTVTASRSLCLRVTAQDTPTIVGRRLQQEWRVWSKRVDDDLAAGNAEAADRDRRIAEYYRVQAAPLACAVRWRDFAAYLALAADREPSLGEFENLVTAANAAASGASKGQLT